MKTMQHTNVQDKIRTYDSSLANIHNFRVSLALNLLYYGIMSGYRRTCVHPSKDGDTLTTRNLPRLYDNLDRMILMNDDFLAVSMGNSVHDFLEIMKISCSVYVPT